MQTPPHALQGNASPRRRVTPPRRRFDAFRHVGLGFSLVWKTQPSLALALGALSLVAGLVPAAIAWVGKRIVDSVVAAGSQDGDAAVRHALMWVAVEAGLVVIVAGAQQAQSMCEQLLFAMLGHRVNVMILEKALTLDLAAFEDSELYDRMTRARRQASQRPLSLVMRSFGLIQNSVSIIAYAALLSQLSMWALAILTAAAIPAFIVETKFSQDAFRLFRWRAPETRRQAYFEVLLAREDFAKEVKLFDLGRVFLARYRAIFDSLFGEDRDLAVRRSTWGFVLGLLSTTAFYGAYAWIAFAAIAQRITLGDMTMYLLVFKQGQAALSAILSAVGRMYEDTLYIADLQEFLAYEAPEESGTAIEGSNPTDGIRFVGVSFRYPGAKVDALHDINLHVRPGDKLALVGENGAGKTTLIKLLTRLYRPTSGTITLDGLPLSEWNVDVLRRRIGVIFQDFVRYQLIVGENIGAGDVRSFSDEERWKHAANEGMADEFIRELPDAYATQLGGWFEDGQELSLGQWQKIALSRAFMRRDADILVLDEPTASMDARAEATIFNRFRELTTDKIVMLISHRFSTVRMADEIIVIDRGEIVERGNHTELMERHGRYAALFTLQAAGYQ